MTVQSTSPSKTKYDMPVGTLLYLRPDDQHLIFLGTCDVTITEWNYQLRDYVGRKVPQAIVFCVEEQSEGNYPLYEFIGDIQKGDLNVVHVPNNPQT